MLHENKLGIFANLILVMFMSSSICQTLYTSFFMTKKLSLTIFIAVIPLALLFFVVFKNKVTTIVSAIVVCIMLIIGLVIILFNERITNAGNWLSGYSIWFIDVINGFYDVSYQLYTNLTLILLTFIITLFVYMFSISFYNFYVISVMFFSVFFIQLQFNIFISNLSFILFIFSFLLYYFFDILQRRSKELTYDIGNKLKYLINIIPICILVIAVSFIFPIKSTRNVLPWLDTKVNSTFDNIIDFFSNKDFSNFDYFSIKATGFGNEGSLGGNIKLSKTHVMDVKSEYQNLYLKASSKAFYDGHNWYDDDKQLIPLGDENTINFDSIEFNEGIKRNSAKKDYSEIYKSANAEIKFVNLKTKSLFIPAKINSIASKTQLNLFFDNEQMLSASEFLNKGFEYTVEYNNLLLSNDAFKTIMRNSYKDYINNFISSSINNSIFNTKDNSSENKEQLSSYLDYLYKLNKKIETIYKKYTQLPVVVTPRVRKLAQDLTKDKDNAYDKAKAIETYLSNNYPYTLTPGNSPRKKDFVDYFLFEGKKGYCTYYASAMTVLLRCVNIPARYVEGYILPPETDKDGVFNVTNQQAHAWVEVYFEGLGWIPFEPTSPFAFGVNMYNDKNISESVSSGVINSGNDDYMDMINRYKTNNAGLDSDIGDINTTPATKTNKLLLVLIILSSTVGSILLAFSILALINIFRHYRTLRRIRKGEPKIAVLLSYNYILKILRLQNISLEPGETPSQFGIRVERTLDFKSYSFNQTSFIKITSHYVNARYSKAALQKDDQQDMLNFINLLLQLTNEKVGKLKYAMARYVLGKI